MTYAARRFVELCDEPLASLLRNSDGIEAPDEPSNKNLKFLAA